MDCLAVEGRLSLTKPPPPSRQPAPTVLWEEVDTYLEDLDAGGKGKQLVVRGQAADETYAFVDTRVGLATDLATLEVTGTSICTLPPALLAALTGLLELRLPNNALAELPAVLFGAGLPLLAVLDLSQNQLSALPPSVVRLPKLEVSSPPSPFSSGPSSSSSPQPSNDATPIETF